jgi:hypothetical protein
MTNLKSLGQPSVISNIEAVEWNWKSARTITQRCFYSSYAYHSDIQVALARLASRLGMMGVKEQISKSYLIKFILYDRELSYQHPKTDSAYISGKFHHHLNLP